MAPYWSRALSCGFHGHRRSRAVLAGLVASSLGLLLPSPGLATQLDEDALNLGFMSLTEPGPDLTRQRMTTSAEPFGPVKLWGLTPESAPLSVFHPLGAMSAAMQRKALSSFCATLRNNFKKLGWRDEPCENLPWHYSLRSEMGHPLIYLEFIDEEAAALSGHAALQTTLLFSGVHPDEITPVHLAFAFARKLHRDPNLYRNARVIIAPLVNPDGFFSQPRTRTNVNGIDLNRNFATADWWRRAGAMWQQLRNLDPRHYPGQAPNTEQGTRFQAELISAFEPDKILTIHAPLGFLDYDGPGDASRKQSPDPQGIKSMQLAHLISRNSRNFRIINYAYFPGSLGNFAGNDRRIPTITVELDTADPSRSGPIMERFFPGLRAAVNYEFKRDLILITQGNAPSTNRRSDASKVGEEISRNF